MTGAPRRGELPAKWMSAAGAGAIGDMQLLFSGDNYLAILQKGHHRRRLLTLPCYPAELEPACTVTRARRAQGTGRPGPYADAVSSGSAVGAPADRAANDTAGRAPEHCGACGRNGPDHDRDAPLPAPPWLSGLVHARPGQARGPCDLSRPARFGPSHPTSDHHPDAARSRHAADHRPGNAPWPGRSGPSG